MSPLAGMVEVGTGLNVALGIPGRDLSCAQGLRIQAVLPDINGSFVV